MKATALKIWLASLSRPSEPLLGRFAWFQDPLRARGYGQSMRFNVAKEVALGQLQQFRQNGSVDAGRRIALIEPAVAAETRRLTDEFHQSRQLDQSEDDLSRLKGAVHTLRGPSEKETVSRTVEKATSLAGTARNGEMSSHELATLSGDNEPYQDTYEWTEFQPEGIKHVTVSIVGDGGVGCGSIISMAEFLSPEPEKSWRERTSTDFLGQDLFAIYNQGTYTPTVDRAS